MKMYNKKEGRNIFRYYWAELNHSQIHSMDENVDTIELPPMVDSTIQIIGCENCVPDDVKERQDELFKRKSYLDKSKKI